MQDLQNLSVFLLFFFESFARVLVQKMPEKVALDLKRVLLFFDEFLKLVG